MVLLTVLFAFWFLVAVDTATDFETWNLVFQDEFSGHKLNTSRWNYSEGCGTEFGNGNLQCYVAGENNVVVENGSITIRAKIEKRENKEFTSGRIVQLGEGFRFGYFVFRARLPRGDHLWPALWLLNRRENCYTEIDIMEAKGNYIQRLVFTAHYGRDFGQLSRHGTAKDTGVDFSSGFHKFGILWTNTKLGWYVDDTLIYEVSLNRETWNSSSGTPCVQAPFTQKMNFIFNIGVGGTFFNSKPYTPEQANKSWVYPRMDIDWVRIYQSPNQ